MKHSFSPIVSLSSLAAWWIAVVPGAHAQTQAGAAWHPVSGHIMTRWAANVDPGNVLPEYPRPQLVRSRWENLNGLWQFAVVSDSASPPPFGRDLSERILVPFAMESSLSGVGRHAERVVYRRTFRRPANMRAGEHLLIHFGAVDWRTTVYVNGKRLLEHVGGYTPFTVDATLALAGGSAEQELVVAVFDPTDAFGQPRGKQVSTPRDIWYTPVTGIWQTVWVEPVPATSIENLVLTPDLGAGVLHVRAAGRGARGAGLRVEAVASSAGRMVGGVRGARASDLRLTIPTLTRGVRTIRSCTTSPSP